MYTYKRAVGNSRLSPKGEELLDISGVPCNTLFTSYTRLTIVVADAYANRDVAIDLSFYLGDLGSFTGNIQAWLDTKKNTPLQTSNTLPGDRYRYVLIDDIEYRAFSKLPGDVRLGREQQELLRVGEAPDMRITKTNNSDVDYGALVDRCLWTINGHMVRATKGETDERCFYLRGAGKHFRVDDTAHVCSLNFNTVSKLSTYPFKLEDIKFESRNGSIYLHVKTDFDLLGKTVWASLGGRLYREDIIHVRANKGIAINIEKVDWARAIFDSKRLIDLGKVIKKDREEVPAGFFETEEFFTNLLLEVSSFLIVLDNPHVYAYTVPLVHYSYPFTFHTEEKRNIPLLTGNGLLPKYFTRSIINRRLLDIDIGIQRLYVGKTAGIYDQDAVHHVHTNRWKPSKLHTGYHLYIRGVIQGD
jgi:hypothetical protein